MHVEKHKYKPYAHYKEIASYVYRYYYVAKLIL